MAAMEAILDFQLEWIYLFLIYNPPWYFLPSFESISLSIQETKGKIDFQVSMVAILDFQSEQFKLYLIYKLPWYFYQVSSQLVFWFRRSA